MSYPKPKGRSRISELQSQHINKDPSWDDEELWEAVLKGVLEDFSSARRFIRDEPAIGGSRAKTSNIIKVC